MTTMILYCSPKKSYTRSLASHLVLEVLQGMTDLRGMKALEFVELQAYLILLFILQKQLRVWTLLRYAEVRDL